MNRKVRWGTGLARVGFVSAIGAQALSVSVSSLSAQAQDAPTTQSTDSPKIKTMNQDNPFFSASKLPFQAPDFASIKPEHFVSAFEAGMAQQLEQVRSIALQQDPPSFENTLVSMEKSGEILTRVAAVFFNLAGAHTNESIQEIEREVAPKLASHSDDIYLNKQSNNGSASKPTNIDQPKLLYGWIDESMHLAQALCRLHHWPDSCIQSSKDRLAQPTHLWNPEPWIKGSDLIRAGLKPGPAFGKLLSQARSMQLDGQWNSEAMALEWLASAIQELKQEQ